MEYYKKYIKYKNKYLQLKNQYDSNIKNLRGDNIKNLRGGNQELFEALKKSDNETAIKIINTLPDLNIKDSEGYSILMLAIINYNQKIVELLIEKGANINYENERKETPLYLCYKTKQYNIAKILFNKNVEIKSEYHETAPLYIIINPLFGTVSEIEELYAIMLIKRGALDKYNTIDNADAINDAFYSDLPKLLTFLISGNYDSEVSGLLYEGILTYAEDNKIQSLIDAVKEKIIIGEININFGTGNFKIRANEKFIVYELKHRISHKLDIDIDNIKLVVKHNGKRQEMDYKRKLSDYGFHKFNGLNIDVVLRMRTGLLKR